MEIFILICIGILLFLGVLGSVIPILPGPLISYIALLLYHFFINSLNVSLLIWIAIVVILISILDYLLQIYAVKKAGGGKYAIRGSLLGMLLGFFLLPPFGILVGAFIGAYIGATFETDENALKIAFGALWGFILGTLLKLSISVFIIYFLFFL